MLCLACLTGPFFFRHEVGNTITATGANYLQMLQQSAAPHLRAGNNLSNIFFQQDGSPTLFAKSVGDFVNTNFPN